MPDDDSIKRVLLINPPVIVKQSWVEHFGYFPLGLAYIAATLVKNNFDVKILDCFIEGSSIQTRIDNGLIRIGMSDDEIVKSVIQYSPDLVGISIPSSYQLSSALHINSIIKQVNGDIITVAGGNHASAMPESISKNAFDWIIIGEGEFRLLNLIKELNAKNTHIEINGVLRASKAKQYRSSAIKNEFIEDLDSIPCPQYGLLPLEKYWKSRDNIRSINIIATRGCPYNCVFCSIKNVMGRKVRYRSVDNVLKEITLLKRKYNVQRINFEDDNLTFNMKWAKELFNKIIQENLGLEFYFRNGIRADKVDLELLTLMKKAGAQRIWFSPESGSQETLDKIIKKKMKLEDCENAVRMAKKVGLPVTCFLIIGFPEESIKDIKQTIKYGHKLKRIGCDSIWISCASPFPGTELFENCIKKGIISSEKLDYMNMSSLDSIINNEHFSSEEIKRLRDKAMIELGRRDFHEIIRTIWRGASLFFSNPSSFIKKSISYFKEAIRNINSAKDMPEYLTYLAIKKFLK